MLSKQAETHPIGSTFRNLPPNDLRRETIRKWKQTMYKSFSGTAQDEAIDVCVPMVVPKNTDRGMPIATLSNTSVGFAVSDSGQLPLSNLGDEEK